MALRNICEGKLGVRGRQIACQAVAWAKAGHPRQSAIYPDQSRLRNDKYHPGQSFGEQRRMINQTLLELLHQREVPAAGRDDY
jgi:hypothetical protein